MKDWIDEAYAAYPKNGARSQEDSIYEESKRLFGLRQTRVYFEQVKKAPERMPLPTAWRWAIRVVETEARQYYPDEEPELRYARHQLR
jgi:hypothetical protein